MAIVNSRSTERYFDPPPYNLLLVLYEVIVKDFADVQECEMILTGPGCGEGTDTDQNCSLSPNNHAKIARIIDNQSINVINVSQMCV